MNFNYRGQLLVSLSLIVAIAWFSCSMQAAECTTLEELSQKLTGRQNLAPQKLFDFDRFKEIFKKSYGSLLEELARKKIFMARAFKVFLSFVGYKHKKSTMFLKVNDKSDWTNEEMRSIETRPAEGAASATASEAADVAADLDDIERNLKGLVENYKGQPGYSEIVEELAKVSEHNRKRRSADSDKRARLSFDDLVSEQVVGGEEEASENFVARVPSNNPEYERPELVSFGSEDNEVEEASLSKSKVDSILGMRGFGVISNFLGSIVDVITAPTTPQEITVRADLPDEVFGDLRTTKCMTTIRNQGRCGSCYIFSTVGLYEWHYCRETGRITQFSEQYPIDCGPLIGMKGCGGGFETDVGKFFGKYGIEMRSFYPYRVRQDTCPYEKRTRAEKMGYLKVNVPNLTEIRHKDLHKYIDRMPILMGFGVSDEFHSYGGGVDVGTHCDRKRGHSMLMIGHGREDGIDYWLVRNSYGPWWGESGHYKLAKEATNCLLQGGAGWILQAPEKGQVFGSKNEANDGSAIKDHLRRLAEQQEADNEPTHFASDSNVATPSSVFDFFRRT